MAEGKRRETAHLEDKSWAISRSHASLRKEFASLGKENVPCTQ